MLDLEMAKAFKDGVPPEGQGYQGVILCVFPPPSSVIVNLRELYQDPDFTAALEQHKGSITGYHDGAGATATIKAKSYLRSPPSRRRTSIR
ncbi:hypothetical protein [Nitrosomonas sp.]|uniref:hypothetical protein n=1 Tax=Nitrosomonas sp. TaxID=42353 RepID=UPI0025DC5B54|nr:hypothetical protein [Nitrosomonas sp.]MBV6447158.1 hypothetical protein [Nitrosomonas sp.]